MALAATLVRLPSPPPKPASSFAASMRAPIYLVVATLSLRGILSHPGGLQTQTESAYELATVDTAIAPRHVRQPKCEPKVDLLVDGK